MLNTRLRSGYTVADLVDELGEWIEDGYVNTAVWKRLQNCVSSDVLPTFSMRARLRSTSGSSESPPSCSQSAGAFSYSAINEAEEDTTSYITTGRKTLKFTFSVLTFHTQFALCFKIKKPSKHQ